MMKPNLVDAHFHLDLIPEAGRLASASDSVSAHVIAVTNAPSVFEPCVRLAGASRSVHVALGLHPQLVDHGYGRELPLFARLVTQTKFVGEVGIDGSSRDGSRVKEQQRIFARVIESCADVGHRVLSVHSRGAVQEVLEAVSVGFPGTIIMHWYSGTARLLDVAQARGFYFSVNPAMVRAQNGRTLVQAMSRERVLTETDGPYVKVGGRAAGPADVREVLTFLGDTWRCSVDEAAERILENFRRAARMVPLS